MMKAGTIRKIFTHLLGWVLFFQLVNLSVDITGVPHTRIASINADRADLHKIETLYELFAGTMLNATLPDTNDEGIDKDLQCFDIVCQRLPDTEPVVLPVSSNHATFQQNNFTSYFPRLPSPPPDAV